MKYDYLIVGAGLFGAVYAHEMHKAGKKCLVIDRRPHIGGNAYTEETEGINVHKVYLSAIPDIYDRRIVAYVIGARNDNPLVFKTFDKAVKANPDAHPLFHSDRGFQYTNRTFHQKLEKAGMKQSLWVISAF